MGSAYTWSLFVPCTRHLRRCYKLKCRNYRRLVTLHVMHCQGTLVTMALVRVSDHAAGLGARGEHVQEAVRIEMRIQ